MVPPRKRKRAHLPPVSGGRVEGFFWGFIWGFSSYQEICHYCFQIGELVLRPVQEQFFNTNMGVFNAIMKF